MFSCVKVILSGPEKAGRALQSQQLLQEVWEIPQTHEALQALPER